MSSAAGGRAQSLGEQLPALLAARGVTRVFGIPGVHTVELYRGLPGSGIVHHTPRHEQGAGFAADGYARVSGKPGVCFSITGPGLSNMITALAQAAADSVPLLVISSVNARARLGHGSGHLHELPDQSRLLAGVCAFSHSLLDAAQLPAVLDRAFAVFTAERPRPVHIEIPTDLLNAPCAALPITPAATVQPPRPATDALLRAAALCRDARRPLLLLGGGARRAHAALTALAERLDAPAVMTVNARGCLPHDHPLAVPASPSLAAVRALIGESDLLLALGTELGPTDYDMYLDGGLRFDAPLIRCDIDARQLRRNHAADLALLGDVGACVAELLDLLHDDDPLSTAPLADGGPASDDSASEAALQSARAAATRAAAARRAARAELAPLSAGPGAGLPAQLALLERLRARLPGALWVGDSSQPVYAGNLYFSPDAPGAWFNSATGYGTLGYALPAALGAALALREAGETGDDGRRRPVICLCGDGGLQFSLGELGSVAEAGEPLILLLWNNRGYGEIRDFMAARGIAPQGVALAAMDFCAIADACGWRSARPDGFAELDAALDAAAAARLPTLIELDAARFDVPSGIGPGEIGRD